MTIEEFNKTAFGADMEMTYKDKVYEIVSVDFEEEFLLFKIESIIALRKMVGNPEVRELVFLKIQKGFEKEYAFIIKLYLDDDFIKICKDELDMDLHAFTEKILKDSVTADMV